MFSLALPARGYAQGEISDCDRAAKIIETGRPAEADKWVFNHSRRCGDRATKAFAAGIARYASETDVAVLEEFMTQADNWRDASIFNAMMQLATNNAATPQARVFAIRHLIVLLQPTDLYTYAGLTRKADTTTASGMTVWQPVGCYGQITSAPRGALRGAPLPANYESRIRSTLTSLANSSTTPEPVRYAAICLQSRRS